MRTTTIACLCAAALLAAAPPPAGARIKMTALPGRERVEIQLDHPGYTLVEEERIVPLLASTAARGNNFVDFSWSNTRIDRDSIQFRPIAIREDGRFRPVGTVDGRPEVEVVNVAYPPGENALVWEIHARGACALKARVSYLIANLTRSFSYRAQADPDERFLVLRKYLQLRNYSGEEFGEAGVWAGFGPAFTKPVEQQTDIRMLLARFDRVPIAKTYTFDWYAHGPLNPDKPFASRVLMHYRLVNGGGGDGGLGSFPLQPGKVRIFIDDGRGGEAFLGEDWAGLTPIDGELKLYLGEARDVVCTRTVQENRRIPVRGNLFHQEVVLRYEIENFKDEPATLDIVEQLESLVREFGVDPRGAVEWENGARTSPELRISRERGGSLPLLSVDLPARPEGPAAAGAKRTVTFHVLLKHLWS